MTQPPHSVPYSGGWIPPRDLTPNIVRNAVWNCSSPAAGSGHMSSLRGAAFRSFIHACSLPGDRER